MRSKARKSPRPKRRRHGRSRTLGPSNDDIPPEELLAPEIGQSPDVLRAWLDCSEQIDRDLDRLHVYSHLTLGYITRDAAHIKLSDHWQLNSRRDYWAGWLAREMSDEPDGIDWDVTRLLAEQSPWNGEPVLTDAEAATVIAQSSDSYAPYAVPNGSEDVLSGADRLAKAITTLSPDSPEAVTTGWAVVDQDGFHHVTCDDSDAAIREITAARRYAEESRTGQSFRLVKIDLETRQREAADGIPAPQDGAG